MGASKSLPVTEFEAYEMRGGMARLVKSEGHARDVDLAVLFMTQFGKCGYVYDENNYRQYLTSQAMWITFCVDLCMQETLWPYLEKSPFDMRADEYSAMTKRALRRFFAEGPTISRDKSEAKLVATKVLVYGLGGMTETLSTATPVGRQYASHFALILTDSNSNEWILEKGQDGVSMRMYHGLPKVDAGVAYRWLLPKWRDVRMEDIKEWAFMQHEIPYEMFSTNCKRMCHDFFRDFNIRVEPYHAFRATVELHYAEAAWGGECSLYTARANPLNIPYRKEYVAEWMSLMYTCLIGNSVPRLDKLAREPFVLKSEGGADIIRRLEKLYIGRRAPMKPALMMHDIEYETLLLVMQVMEEVIRLMLVFTNLGDLRDQVFRMFRIMHNGKPSMREMARLGLYGDMYLHRLVDNAGVIWA